jgi:hypothetical protein
MPLNLTKIAFGASSYDELQGWYARDAEDLRLTTRYLPKRQQELTGGSLYWILGHMLVARSAILGFEQRPDDGRWWIRLERRLMPVEPRPKRAHQGWRYLAASDAPPDIGPDIGGTADQAAALPAAMVTELARLGLA